MVAELVDAQWHDEEFAVTAARTELTDRVRRVLPLLLAEHRWPTPKELCDVLPLHVGAVFAAQPMTRFDRTAKLRVSGAAATYCWEYLPDPVWRLIELPPPAEDAEDVAPPLIWCGPAGVVADRLLVGVQHRSDTVAAASWEWAAEWSAMLPEPISAVRLLPLSQLPQARLVTAGGVLALRGTQFDTLGGVWR
jgi:hypothetical protein